MSKAGSDYEKFVAKKLRSYIPNAKIVLNDKILGRQSGLLREIDISIRIDFGEGELLYIIQCKDRAKRPADIVILGEFSSVIRDVGASKGFLICRSGFAKSNRHYAETIGIELLTIEDIRSERWRTDIIQIPIFFIKKSLHFKLSTTFIVNEELARRKQDNPDFSIDPTFDTQLKFNETNDIKTIKEYATELLANGDLTDQNQIIIEAQQADLQINLGDIWLDCPKLSTSITINKKKYLKYATPTEYSHIRDHRRGSTIPLNVDFATPVYRFDDDYIEIAIDETPVTPCLYFTIEEWTFLEQPQPGSKIINVTEIVPLRFNFPTPPFFLPTGTPKDTIK